jgi:hypothetical protein
MHSEQSWHYQLCEWWTCGQSFQVQPSQKVSKCPISHSNMGVEVNICTSKQMGGELWS